MSDRPYDEPAFPIRGGLNEHQFSGLTLRDYFAAKAMHALLVADGTVHFPNRAKEAYEMADAMLIARAQP